MGSDTRNVKLGVCKVFYDGIDLGYTKGGVEVEVTTDTKSVEVDQFGNTPIDDIIMGRKVSVKVPLAETTVFNMQRIMPGSTLSSDGVKATGTITVASPIADDTVVVNGVTFTFKASGVGPAQVTIGGTAAATAANLLAKLNASTDPLVRVGHYTLSGAVITVTHDDVGVAGNAFTLAKTGTGITLSAATLASGAEATYIKISVPSAVGYSLLENAKELRLHPKRLLDTDRSEDFVIPKSATPGALTFAYNFENERVFNTTFMGYPNAVTEELFYFGDASAIA